MKILIVDDEQANLAVAREVAKQFPKHRFTFLESAAEALARIPEFSGLITDLFMPEEANRDLLLRYQYYLANLCRDASWDVIERYHAGLTGTISVEQKAQETLRRLVDGLDPIGSDPRRLFAFGAILMMSAFESGKRQVLVTNLHRHTFPSGAGGVLGIQGWVALAPLVAAGAIGYDDVSSNGANFQSYVSIGAVQKRGVAAGGQIKQDPEVWQTAIERLLAQKTDSHRAINCAGVYRLTLPDEEVKQQIRNLRSGSGNQITGEDLDKILDGRVVSTALRAHLFTLRFSSFGFPSWDQTLTIVDPDTAVWASGYSENTGMGLSFFDYVFVYHKGVVKSQKWQWRDGRDQRNDRRGLRIGNIEKATLDNSGSVVVVVVELDRSFEKQVRFEFDRNVTNDESVPVPTIEEVAELYVRADREIKLLMASKLLQRDLIVGDYVCPSLVETRKFPEGVVVCVTEQQIDQQASDRQMRCELWAMSCKDGWLRLITEDHAYIRREGSPHISIQRYEKGKLVLGTRNGEQEFAVI